MKKLHYIAFIILFIFLSFTLAEDKFPLMEVETLTDEKMSLPNDVKGKYTLLTLAYSKKAEEDLKTWNDPLYLKFIAEQPKDALFAFEGYDINLFFIPMFTGVNQTAEGSAKKKMKKQIDEKLQPYFLIFKGKLKDYKSKLNLKKKDEPYLFLLNEEGEIVYKTSGAYSKAKLDAIENQIEP